MYHFINCLALTFLPHVILYRATKLMEESGFRSCVFSAIGYAATQAVKMLVMATILPSPHHDADVPLHTSTPSITLSQEIFQSLVQILELIGIQFTLQMAPNLSKFSTHARILAVAIGWSFAESVAFYLVPLWIGARGMEFSWQYIELGLSSNVNLVIHFAVIAAVWLRTRTDLHTAAVPVVYAILLLGLTLPSITQYALHVLGINSWAVLGARALVGVSCAGMVHLLLSQYSSRPGANKYKNN